MDSITTGRPLDETGEPAEGPALELDPDGRAVERFAESPHPLASGPGSEMWSTILRYPSRDRTDAPAMLVWLGPDAMELPPHVHPIGSEYFRALRGEVTLVVDGDRHRLSPGQEMTIEAGDEHYFRNETGDYAAFYVEPPWEKTIDTQFTVFGMDHEGIFGDPYGEPDVLQGLLLAEYVRAGTRITAAPVVLQRVLWATVGRLARALGRQAVDERYLDDEFWLDAVEQPDI